MLDTRALAPWAQHAFSRIVDGNAEARRQALSQLGSRGVHRARAGLPMPHWDAQWLEALLADYGADAPPPSSVTARANRVRFEDTPHVFPHDAPAY